MLTSRSFKSVKLLIKAIGTIGVFWFLWDIAIQAPYREYESLYEYRRLHPEFIPSTTTSRYLAVGHNTTSADLMWMQTIQLIGDNIGNGKYVDFINTYIDNITGLHPYFVKPYETSLLFAPSISPADSDESIIAEKKKRIQRAVEIGEKGMQTLCETGSGKLDTIIKSPINQTLWKDSSLRNPCLDGMIPYYLGHAYADLGEVEKSINAYKIASIQDDAPGASRFLSVLAAANEGEHMKSALTFFLIAKDGYDTSPYICSTLAKDLFERFNAGQGVNITVVEDLSKKESALKDNKDTNNPESYSTTNCYDSIERGIKQVYLSYITESAKQDSNIKDGSELIKKGLIPFIPTIQSQSGFTVVQTNGIWRYREVFK